MLDDETVSDGESAAEEQPKQRKKREKKTPEEIQQQLELEITQLLDHLADGIVDTMRDRVSFILNRFTDARNSDIELVWKYWQTFETDKMPDRSHVTKEAMYELSRMPSLIRERQRIQNTYKLFQADENVRDARGTLEEQARQQAVEDKPDYTPNSTVYIDETGKTQNYLSVGGLWIQDSGMSVYNIQQNIENWRTRSGINYEFHYSKVGKDRVATYKEFFTRFLRLNSSAGFKIAVVRNSGFSDKARAITDLTYHLLKHGIDHEHHSGRALLPRLLQVWMDADAEGTDAIKVANVKERLTAQRIEGLKLDTFNVVSSDSNYYIQAIDLFTGAINRKLHHDGEPNYKDDLADYILAVTGMQIDKIDTGNNDIDTAVVFDLNDFNL